MLLPVVIASLLAAQAPSEPSAAPSAAPTAEANGEPTVVASPAGATPRVEELYLPYTGPGCFGDSGTSLHLADAIYEHFDGAPGSASYTGVSLAPLWFGRRYLLPDGALSDTDALDRFLEAAKGATLEREVIEADLSVIEDEYELAFQVPFEGRPDWISVIERHEQKEGREGTLRRHTADLVRYRAGKESALALELEGAEPALELDLGHAVRQPTLEMKIDGAGPPARIYELGKRLGESGRSKAEVDRLLTSLPKARSLALHLGGLGSRDQNDEERQACGEALRAAGFAAMAVRGAELVRGVEALANDAERFALPFVAANLEDARDGKGARPFPAYRLRRVAGLDVAIVGAVGSEQLDRLPVAVRRQWRVEPPREAVERALREIRDKLPEPPDLIVLLTSAQQKELQDLSAVSGLDLVIAAGASDLIKREEEVRLHHGAPGRGAGDYAMPALVVITSNHSIGRVSAVLSTDGEDTRLTALRHARWPVLQEGPADLAFRKTAQGALHRLARQQEILLPDVDPIADANEALQPLVMGERVLDHMRFERYGERSVARYTDLLWMRLVTNALRQELGAEVAVARNLARNDSITGPIPRLVVENWFHDTASVQVVTLPGEVLLALAQRISQQQEIGRVRPQDWIFAAGLDVERRRVAGRPIEPRLRYRVALADSLLAIPDVAEILRGRGQAEERFRRADDGFVPDPEGEPLLVRDVGFAALERYTGEGGAHASDRTDAFVRDLFLDHAGDKTSEWRLRVDELSLQASAYRNTPNNLALFASSRETRTTTPDLYIIGARAKLDLTWDSPLLAWENGLRLTLSTQIIDIPGVDIPPQEQADDVVAYTELRLNNINLAIGTDDFQVIPFGRFALDSEVTQTPDPADATKSLPHQILVQQSLGLVSYPGTRLKEVRLGALVQQDLGELTQPIKGSALNAVHLDYGLVAGLRFELPLWMVVLSSETDVRYLVPDGDDRASDLSLRLASTNKLIVPLGSSLHFFVFADSFVVSGKLEDNRELGASFIVGGGMGFSDVLKL